MSAFFVTAKSRQAHTRCGTKKQLIESDIALVNSDQNYGTTTVALYKLLHETMAQQVRVTVIISLIFILNFK